MGYCYRLYRRWVFIFILFCSCQSIPFWLDGLVVSGKKQNALRPYLVLRCCGLKSMATVEKKKNCYSYEIKVDSVWQI